MTSIRFCVLSAALIVVVATDRRPPIPECTTETIDNCNYGKKPSYQNDCSSYKKTVKCLETLQPSCKDDRVMELLENLKTWSQRGAGDCPGLPEKTCWSTIVKLCMEIVPQDVIAAGISQTRKDNLCNGFKSKSVHAKACLTTLKGHCIREAIHRQIDQFIGLVQKVDKECGF